LEEEEGGDGSVVVVVVVLAMVVIFDAVVANVEGVLLEEVGNGFDSVLLLQALDEVEEGGAHHDVDVHVVDEFDVGEFGDQVNIFQNESLEALVLDHIIRKIILLHMLALCIDQKYILIKHSLIPPQIIIRNDHNRPIELASASNAHNASFQQRTFRRRLSKGNEGDGPVMSVGHVHETSRFVELLLEELSSFSFSEFVPLTVRNGVVIISVAAVAHVVIISAAVDSVAMMALEIPRGFVREMSFERATTVRVLILANVHSLATFLLLMCLLLRLLLVGATVWIAVDGCEIEGRVGHEKGEDGDCRSFEWEEMEDLTGGGGRQR